MRKQILLFLVLVIVLGGAGYLLFFRSIASFTPEAVQTSPYKDVTLHIGSVTNSVPDATKEYQLLASYLQNKLGVKAVEPTFAHTALEMAVMLRKNKEDMIIENPFASFALRSVAQTTIELGTVENGVSSYRSVFIVPQNSSIKNVADLPGHLLAFRENDSASAYFLPKADLVRKGLKLVEKESPNSTIQSDEVGYYFSNDNEVTLKQIYKGIVSAGAMSEDKFKEHAKDYDNRLKILDTTLDISPHVVSFRKDLDPALKHAIIAALLSMHNDSEGKKALMGIQVDKMIPLEQNPKLMGNMETLSAAVQDETLTH